MRAAAVLAEHPELAVRRVRVTGEFPRNGPGARVNPMPSERDIAAVKRLLGKNRFWVCVAASRGWTDFPAEQVARLLVIRLHNPAHGVRMLLAGSVFKPTPSVSIRLAITISRLEGRR
jgi:hypothetical protein